MSKLLSQQNEVKQTAPSSGQAASSRPVTDRSGRELLLDSLRDPTVLRGLSASEWETLIPQAKCVSLWRQLAIQVRQMGFLSDLPQQVRMHVESACTTADAYATSVRWEVNRLQAALADIECPLVLLKGAAYLCDGMAWSAGRSFQDVDLLAPADSLPAVEAALRRHGWVDSDESPLDAEYFRLWLQELPPLWHHERKIQVDIHHSIIPPKARTEFDPAPLFENCVPVSGNMFVLSPTDMFLHAASNLFWTGEFTSIMRDLYDMHAMICEFANRPGYWAELIERAEKLQLTRPCYYALRYLQQVFETPVPAEVVQAAADWRPNWLVQRFIDMLVRRTLFPDSLDRVDTRRNFALTIREYSTLPRFSMLFNRLFWLKRLPSWAVRAKTGNDSTREE